MDTEEEFGIEIDNYLCCDWDEMRTILQDFKDFGIDTLGENLPQSIRGLLLKNAEKLDADSLINAVEKREKFLDNQLGLAFLNECAYMLMYANGENLYSYAGNRLKECYSLLDTNINTETLKDFQRILRFLDPETTEYIREVVTADDNRATEKIKREKKLKKIVILILIILMLLLMFVYFTVGIIYNSGNFSITLDSNLYFEKGLIIYDDFNYKVYRTELYG